jgi:2-polyprenyl-3-methyl-5-hydroxy-6-metoxy-1,4-benzoquinol methylase
VSGTPARDPSAEAFFRAVAPAWSGHYRAGGALAERVPIFAAALEARVPPPAAILDFGCGSGEIARHLVERGWRVTGCDITEAMIRAARAADPEARVAWHLVEQGQALPFEHQSFDAVISSSVLEYVARPEVTLAMLAGLLKPRGYLLVSVPDPRDPARRREARRRAALRIPGVAALARRTRWAEGAHYLLVSRNRFPLERWARLLRAAGLEPEPAPTSRGALALLAARKA